MLIVNQRHLVAFTFRKNKAEAIPRKIMFLNILEL